MTSHRHSFAHDGRLGSAVHFGAGNIGRGFIGLALHRAGYRLTFIDVDAALVARINHATAYRVREVGGSTVHTVDGCSAVNAAADRDAASRAVASASVVTCAVGPTLLRAIAPTLRRGLELRDLASSPLVVMACENAVNASGMLRDLVLDGADDPLAGRVLFANTAVDRIIPTQSGDTLDLEVEAFSEWTIQGSPRFDQLVTIPDAHVVDELGPYVERKLFTMNTGHATAAYHGVLAGAETIAEAMSIGNVRNEVETTLAETSALLMARHPSIADEQKAYLSRSLARLSDPALPDTCARIGREPLRKISRRERFVAPAAQIAERGGNPEALVRAYGAALRFRAAADPESRELAALLLQRPSEEFVTQMTGIEPRHPLFAALVSATSAAASADAAMSLG